jgi:hypothetical protein
VTVSLSHNLSGRTFSRNLSISSGMAVEPEVTAGAASAGGVNNWRVFSSFSRRASRSAHCPPPLPAPAVPPFDVCFCGAAALSNLATRASRPFITVLFLRADKAAAEQSQVVPPLPSPPCAFAKRWACSQRLCSRSSCSCCTGMFSATKLAQWESNPDTAAPHSAGQLRCARIQHRTLSRWVWSSPRYARLFPPSPPTRPSARPQAPPTLGHIRHCNRQYTPVAQRHARAVARRPRLAARPAHLRHVGGESSPVARHVATHGRVTCSRRGADAAAAADGGQQQQHNRPHTHRAPDFHGTRVVASMSPSWGVLRASRKIGRRTPSALRVAIISSLPPSQRPSAS